MIWNRHRSPSPVRVHADEGDVLSLANDSESQTLEGLQNLRLGSVGRKLIRQTATPVSAMNASKTGESKSAASGPKVSR